MRRHLETLWSLWDEETLMNGKLNNPEDAKEFYEDRLKPLKYEIIVATGGQDPEHTPPNERRIVLPRDYTKMFAT